MKLHIKAVTGNKFTIEADPSLTVEEFKALVAETSEVPVENQRLIYKGHILRDPQTLESYGMADESTLHLVRAPGQQSASTSTPTTPTATSTPTAATQSPSTAASPVAPANLFGGGLGGLGGLGAMPPNVAQMASNPDFMNTMMNNPMVQSMLDNPETLRAIINANPQMRELMERNPEIRHALDNPQLLRQSMEAMRNPDMMREMMRNTDRAMSNIEAHPEGFNALRRMYQDFQEPLMEATTASNPFMSMFQPPNTSSETTQHEDTQNTPLSNPWAAPPQQTRQQPTLGAGLGGMDLGAFGGMPPMGMGGMGGMPAMDPQMLGQMMQDPMVQNMMTTMLSNPQFMQQAIDSNPMLRQMIQNNPGMRDTLSNPEFLRRLADPNTIQAMLQMQGAMQQLQRSFGTLNETGGTAAVNPYGTTQGTTPSTNPSSAAQTPRPFDLSAMMNSMAMGGGAGLYGTPQPQVPPAQLYATQLQQLQAMGFYDEQQNISALQATGGNVSAAVERLLQQ